MADNVEQSFEKDRFEASLKLAQVGLDQWERRRVYEWRVTFGLWALLAGAIAVKDVKFPIWVGPVLFAGYVLFWLRQIWLANERNCNFARHYLIQAQRYLDPTAENLPSAVSAPRDRSWRSSLQDWAQVFQAISTGVLIALVYIIKGW